jgi:serine/threonine-protein kinase
VPEIVREAAQPVIVGRYALFRELAAGGMATVHLGRLLGPVGFSRTIAVKRLHPQYAKDPDFVGMFLDEANLVSRIRHPNVVPTLDIVNSPSAGLMLVMEYVHGDSLSRLARKCREAQTPIPPRMIAGIMSNVLLGLHAAHEARGMNGEPLNIVHRDVSPQNVLVGADGVARVLDFGVAKAAGRAQTTREGQVKGKLAYMAPEQIRGKVDRRTDVFAAGIVTWELLAGRRMFDGQNEAELLTRVISGQFPSPTMFAKDLPPQLVAVTMRALSADPDVRFATAKEMALEMEKAVGGVASPSEISEWVEALSKNELHERMQYVESIERASAALSPARTDPPPPPDVRGMPSGTHPVNGNGKPGKAAAQDFDLDMVEFHKEISTNNGTTNNGVFLGETEASAPAEPPSRIWYLAAAMIFLAVAGAGLLAFGLYRSKSTNAVEPMPTMTVPIPSSAVAPVINRGSASSDVAPVAPSAAPTAASPPPRSAPSAAASAASNDLEIAEPGPTAAPSAAAPSVTASEAPSTAAAPTNAPTNAPTAAPTAPRPIGPVWVAPTVKTGQPAKGKCDPPYTLDAQGHKHFKPECTLD